MQNKAENLLKERIVGDIIFLRWGDLWFGTEHAK
tara:strand:- start:254 stop:355 length:102 start_codon:yes stop_codon:yes gene_type:complete